MYLTMFLVSFEGNQTSFRRDCDLWKAVLPLESFPEGNQTSFRRDCDGRTRIQFSKSMLKEIRPHLEGIAT